jgi:hypothetical protein
MKPSEKPVQTEILYNERTSLRTNNAVSKNKDLCMPQFLYKQEQ